MVAEGDSVICAGLLGTEEWPVLKAKANAKDYEVSVQGEDSKMKRDLDETGETTPQKVTLKEGVMSEAPPKKIPGGKTEKKRGGFKPAPELQRSTLVDFLPAKMGLHCCELCEQCLACYSLKLVNSPEGPGTHCQWHLIGWQRGDGEECRAAAAAAVADDVFEILADECDEGVLKAGRFAMRLKGNGRPKRVDKVASAQRLAKEKQIRSRSYLRNTGGNPIKTVHVKKNVSRNKAKKERLADAIAAKKANVEKRLRVLKRERRGPVPPKNPTHPSANNYLMTDQTQPRNAKPVKYELKEADVSHYATSEEEAKLLKHLALIQHRDILPEDYDLLLRLDERVSKRTLGSSRLKSLRAKSLTDADVKDIMNSDFAGARCAVCMDCYYANQVVKWLPCQHIFHSNCIDMWLGNAGSICPLDGLEV